MKLYLLIFVYIKELKKGGYILKRTAEKVLSIISAIFTAAFIVFGFISVGFFKLLTTDPEIRAEFEAGMLDFDPTLTSTEFADVFASLDFFEGIIWFLIVSLIISFIVTIVGIVFIWNSKNSKLAGVMFIVAGLFAYVLSPTSILLYIAAILCFTRKAPFVDEPLYVEGNHDQTMRPL